MLLIKNVRTNGMRNPIGITISQPKFSWYLESDQRNTCQTAYQVIVSENEKEIERGIGSYFDSGRVHTTETWCRLGHPVFQSAARLYWSVRVWDNHGEETGWSEVQWFETGLLKKSDWQAKWVEPIQCPVFNNGNGYSENLLVTPAEHMPIPEAELSPCPILRRRFQLDQNRKIKRARIYATAHGVYQLSLNGRRVGDLELMPEATPYHDMLQVQTYDVTELLAPGENVVGAVLGNGWWAGSVSYNANSCVYGNKLALLMQLQVEYGDGNKCVVGTDERFVSYFGETLYSDIGVGEKIDCRREIKGWNQVGVIKCAGIPGEEQEVIEGTWIPVEVKDYGYGNLCGQNAEPVRVKEILKPVGVKRYGDGTLLLDFGQIIAGNTRIEFDGTGRRGEEILLSYCEQVDKNGDFLYNFAGYRQHEDIFILSGEEKEVYEPKFTWRGFRWLRIKGYSGELCMDKAEARLIASDVDCTSQFVCSDPRITKLQKNIQWTLINNLLSIPTDNPDRERAGWTGDMEMVAATMFYNWQVCPFITRWLAECRLEQYENGALPFFVPRHEKSGFVAPAGWGDAAVIVPWEAYWAYGDKEILQDNYEMMQKWMEYVAERCKRGPSEETREGRFRCNLDFSMLRDYGPDMTEERKERLKYLWTADFQFGDWMTPSGNFAEDGSWRYWSSQNNETFYPCYYLAYCTKLMSQIAEILGKETDANYYTQWNRKIREAVIAEFYDTGYIPNSEFQGVLVLALRAELYPDGQREVLEKRLLDVIYQYNEGCLNTGFASMEHIMQELTQIGRVDTAYDLLLNERYPSFVYMIDHDATAIWETWLNILEDDTVNTASYTQYGMGNIGKWLMGGLAGISAAEPGYKRIRIAPAVDTKRRITSAKAEIETPNGKVSTSWNVEGTKVCLKVHIPVNTTAEILFEGSEKEPESVGSGDYQFIYEPNWK